MKQDIPNDNFIPNLIAHWNGHALSGLALKQKFETLYIQDYEMARWMIVDDKENDIFFIQPAKYSDNGLINPISKEITFVNSTSLGLICTYSILGILIKKDMKHISNAINILAYLKENNPYLIELTNDIASDFQLTISNNKKIPLP